MLHTVNKSPFTHNTLTEAARFATKGSVILLIEDGTLAARSGSKHEPALKEIMSRNDVYALEPDMKARGVGSVAEGVKLVDYDGFVDLVAQHKTNTWL